MPKIKLSKKFVVTTIVVLVVGLAALGAGIGLRWWQDGTKLSQTDPKDLPETIETAQNLASSGDFEGAHKKIEEDLGRSGLSNQQQYELYFQQGNTYFNESKYNEALDSFKKAAAVKETQSIYETMANTSEILSNKEAAIEYYKKAIQLILPDNRVGAADKQSYEMKIRELGGQP